MQAPEMDAARQAMLDAAANDQADPHIDTRILDLIDERLPQLRPRPDRSIISVLDQAGLSRDGIAGIVRLIIGGGQNEPRDAIAGTAWALLAQPRQKALIDTGKIDWRAAFNECNRLVSPIGMSPRRIAHHGDACGVTFDKDDLIFFMFGAACRDPAHFSDPGKFNTIRDTGPAIPFDAGPHFCAGAAASRSLVAGFALPMLFGQLPDQKLTGDAPFSGWAFRGPTHVPLGWKA